MANDAPIQTPLRLAPPAPPEDVEQSKTSAFAGQAATQFESGNLGSELVSRGVGALYKQGDPRNVHVPYDQAVKLFKDQNMDPGAIPRDGWSVGAISSEMSRQEDIQRAQVQSQRANVSSTGQFVASFVGNLGDPINFILGPIGGKVLGGVRAGLAGRAALGAAEGGTGAALYVAAQKHLEGHDADIASLDTVRNILYGAATGGLLHTAFGARPLARAGEGLSLDTVAELERSDAAAKAQGVKVDDVVSPAGAMGKYQVMPETAKALGVTGDLHDPAVNKEAATKLLDQLTKRYGNDPEAIAVAYNAGPRRADRWIEQGRNDNVLPAETRGYLFRLRGTSIGDREDAAKLAVAQLSEDSPVNIEPIASFKTNPFRIQDEHEQEVSNLTTQAFQAAVPKSDSMFETDETKELVSRMEKEGVPLQPEKAQEMASDIMSSAKEQAASIGRDEAFNTQMAEHEAAPEFGTLKHDEMTKAVQSAVNCGVMKGLSYAAD